MIRAGPIGRSHFRDFFVADIIDDDDDHVDSFARVWPMSRRWMAQVFCMWRWGQHEMTRDGFGGSARVYPTAIAKLYIMSFAEWVGGWVG
jgi:hypothetical protein